MNTTDQCEQVIAPIVQNIVLPVNTFYVSIGIVKSILKPTPYLAQAIDAIAPSTGTIEAFLLPFHLKA
jgi:hypothetical protein